jgi:hypothetical protein
MINLLPDDIKREIRAARMNVILLRYNLLILSALGMMITLCLLFYIILQSTQSHAVSTSNDNSEKAASFASVRKEADEYRNNLSIASKILDNSLPYTTVIFQITKLLPTGVNLDGLSLNASDFGQQVVFSAHARGYAQATQLKQNFQNSNLFTNVFFQNLVDNGATSSTPVDYPIGITISAKLNKVSP